MISASRPFRCRSFTAFDGDLYADETPVYRGLSLPRVSASATSNGAPAVYASETASGPLAGFGLSPWINALPAFPSAPVCPCIIRGAVPPKALRSTIVDYIRTQGEADVQLSEKRDVLKAKVQIFVDTTQEVLGIAIRIRAGTDGATAEWRRHSGDALQFHHFFRQVKEAVEVQGETPLVREIGSASFDLASIFPVTSLEDALAAAEVMPEEAAAALARSIPHVDASEVKKLPRYIRTVQDWLTATDVRVAGPACSLAKHICQVDRTCAPALMATAVEQAEIALGEAPAMPPGQPDLRPRLLLRLASRLASLGPVETRRSVSAETA